MLLDYYHLREQPFGVTPDPRYLYLSATHREALASLYYGIEVGRGFMALIAKTGMGKTTLLFQLLERLRKSSSFAFLFQTQCNSREFRSYLPRETLNPICVQHFGGCERESIEQIHALDPRITDPDHIETGQRIVLPGRTQSSTGADSAGLPNGVPITSARN